MQINKNSLKKEIIGYKKIELNTKELEIVIEQIKNLRVNEIQKAAHISLEEVVKVLEKQSRYGGMSDFEKKLLKEVDRKWFVENLDKIISFLSEEEKKEKKIVMTQKEKELFFFEKLVKKKDSFKRIKKINSNFYSYNSELKNTVSASKIEGSRFLLIKENEFFGIEKKIGTYILKIKRDKKIFSELLKIFLIKDEKKQKEEMNNFKIKYKEKTEEIFKREKPTFKEWIEGVEIRNLISIWNDETTIKNLKDIMSLEVNYDIVKKQIKRW